jgi:hypothetical protein
VFEIGAVQDLPVPHDDGTWHSAEIARTVEAIRDYNHRLDVGYIPEHLREEGDAAFAIFEHTADGRKVVAFYVQTEEEMKNGTAILARIYAGDNAKHDVQARVEAANAANLEMRRRRYEDAMGEAHEKAHFLYNLDKSKTKLDGKVIDL